MKKDNCFDDEEKQILDCLITNIEGRKWDKMCSEILNKYNAKCDDMVEEFDQYLHPFIENIRDYNLKRSDKLFRARLIKHDDYDKLGISDDEVLSKCIDIVDKKGISDRFDQLKLDVPLSCLFLFITSIVVRYEDLQL